MRTLHRLTCSLIAVGALSACSDPLGVENRNLPERDRVLATPADAEAFLAGTFRTIHSGLYNSNNAIAPALMVMGMESFSSNSNFCMATRGSVPRNQIDNTRGNQCEVENAREFNFLHRAARSATLVQAKLYDAPGFTLGSEAQNNRAKAYSWFTHGLGLGYLALAYDSAAIVSYKDDPQVIVPLSGYNDVMAAALVSLDSAITIAARGGAGTGGFPLPADWIPSTTSMTSDNFQRLARSYKALFRANVARTTQERGAVDWDKVIADANGGLTADLLVSMLPAGGVDYSWAVQHYLYQAWHQNWSLIVGMADTSGAYDAWLATPPAQKAIFTVATPDKRFPFGATRAAQVASSNAAAWDGTSFPYLRNRSAGDETTSNPWANSQYDFNRHRKFYDAVRIGAYPILAKATIDMLAAEGYIRKQQWDNAMAKINPWRTRAGLPALAGIASLTDPVPGGSACVPRVPSAAANFLSSTCGNIMEAMKWEYRMESQFTNWGSWYFAGRGWGDLPEGTPLSFPVPYNELDTRRLPSYNLGGVGGKSAAPKGNYGI